jgi:hypothetical protein
MSDPAAVFHAAQVAALKGSAELAALFPGGVARVFAVPPENAALPLIKVGDDQVIEDGDECLEGSEIVAAVHIWTKPDPPDVQLGRQMAGLVRAILVTSPTPTARRTPFSGSATWRRQIRRFHNGCG